MRYGVQLVAYPSVFRVAKILSHRGSFSAPSRVRFWLSRRISSRMSASNGSARPRLATPSRISASVCYVRDCFAIPSRISANSCSERRTAVAMRFIVEKGAIFFPPW